jgi:hypothetical protein
MVTVFLTSIASTFGVGPSHAQVDGNAQELAKSWNCTQLDSIQDISSCNHLQNGAYIISIRPKAREGRYDLDAEVRVDSAQRTVYSAYFDSRVQLALADSVFYATDFLRSASGMSVVALDLTTLDTLWVARLEGIGPQAHFRYGNWGATLTPVGRFLVVCGSEMRGSYVEVLDRWNGKTLANIRK